jgi:type II secretory pathway pseudopilin PulG
MKSRSAFALVAALVALVLMAVLITGALFASGQESRSAGAELADQKVFSFAERAALETAAGWACPECDLLPVGSVIIRNPAAPPPLESTVYITRLDSAVFLITGEARISVSTGSTARRRVSIAVEITRDSLGTFSASRIAGDSWITAYQM